MLTPPDFDKYKPELDKVIQMEMKHYEKQIKNLVLEFEDQIAVCNTDRKL
jgi:hypothetical protein